MKHNLVALIVLLTANLFIDAATTPDDHIGSPDDPLRSYRWPVVRVPQGNPYLIDGQVTGKGEYSRSAKLQDFVTIEGNDRNGQAAENQTELFLTYTENALYVGFRIFMPEGVAPVVSGTEGHDKFFSDDSIDIFLTSDPNGRRHWHIGGNAGGVTWERLFDRPDPGWVWNPKLKYAAKVCENRWEGEFEIPWAELGVEMPKPGTIWRANFLTNRRNAPTRLDAWSYSSWNNYKGDGYLIFGGTGWNYLSWKTGLSEAWKNEAWIGMVTQPSNDPPRKIEYEATLLARDPKAHGGLSFFSDLQSRRDQAEGEAATWTPFADDLNLVRKTFSPVHEWHESKTLPAPGYTVLFGPHVHVEKAGDYLFHYQFRDVTDTNSILMLAAGAVPFRVVTGVQVTANPYLLTRQSVVLSADLRSLENRDRVKKLRGYVTRPGDAKVLSEATVKATGEKLQDVEVKVIGLDPGKYDCHISAIDVDGKVISSEADRLTIDPTPDWWVNRDKYGSEPEVPWPWTPIRWKDGTVEVWGRTIVFGNSPLPTKIVNQGEDILAAPIALELKASGQVQAWKNQTARVAEQKPGHVLRKTSQEAAGVRIRSEVRTEFDGFSLCDFYIEPIKDSVELDSLEMVMLIRSKYAEFLTCHAPAQGPPAKDIFGDRRYVGRTPAHYESPVMLTTWLGTDDLGLEWSAESARDWSLKTPKNATVIDRKGDVTEVRFRLVDHPIKLDRGRHIRLGMIPTPTKLVPPERLNWRVESGSQWPPFVGHLRNHGDKAAIPTQQDLDDWKKRFVDEFKVDTQILMGPSDWTGKEAWVQKVEETERRAWLKYAFTTMKQYGMCGAPWGGWAAQTLASEWAPWGKEMVAQPVEPTLGTEYIHSYASPFVERMVGCMTWNARELGVSGIRFDTVVPWRFSANPYLDEAWVSDTDGKTYGTQNLYRQREMLKRLYRVFHGGVIENGVVYLPIGGPPILCVESFEDIHEIGEGKYMKATSLKLGYVPDEVRVWMTGRPYGYVTSNNLKGRPLALNQRIGTLLVHDATPRLSVRPGTYRDDYGPDSVPTPAIWRAWSWIDRGTAQWWPYWKNKDMVNTTGSGEHYTSLWLQPGRRVLVVVCNYENQLLKASVQLNLKSLGFSENAPLAARDAITKEAIVMNKGQLELQVGEELYRLVAISMQAELDGAPLDAKH